MYCAGRKALAVMLTVGCFVPLLTSCGNAPVGGGSTVDSTHSHTTTQEATTVTTKTEPTTTTIGSSVSVDHTTSASFSSHTRTSVTTKRSTTVTTTSKAPVTTTTATALPEPWFTGPAVTSKTSIKVLAIGNSYSVNAMKYLYELLKAGGYETVVLGNLFIPGCALDTHEQNMQKNLPEYIYYFNDDGRWVPRPNYTVSKALASEEWDVVTLQQASFKSGLPTSYAPLLRILDYLEEHRPAAHTRFVWHQTWAYQTNFPSQDFARYESDQMTMYEYIVSAIRWKVIPETRITAVIPSGTAIQNLRSSQIGDTLNVDGTHLTEGLGCYTASMAWYCALTGKSADTVTWTPDGQEVAPWLGAVQEAVRNALAIPDAVTPSVDYAPQSKDLL